MKSHDCHVLLMQILPVAIRGIMDEHVRDTLLALCNFFDVINRKSIGVKQLDRLQEEIVLILCELEIYFPPAFFDICVHLLLHVVDDIRQLGPTFTTAEWPIASKWLVTDKNCARHYLSLVQNTSDGLIKSGRR